MEIEDSSLVYSKDEKLKACTEETSCVKDLPKTKIEIDIQPVKKKKRFIYYGLSIFSSFIAARLALIAISLYSLNFDKLILNNMKYDSARHDSFTLDVSLINAYSPLFICIKDIDCDVFGIDKQGFQRRLFSLDVPDIEIVKYKTLRFIHDIRFINFTPKDIMDCSDTKTVRVKVRGKLCYRFCLMKFYLRWEKDKVITVRDDKQGIQWPKINKVNVKKDGDLLCISMDVDHSKITFPPFVSIVLAQSHIRCSRDFPCSIFFAEQKVDRGHFRTPLVINIQIDKENYGKISGSILNLLNYKDVIVGIDSITTNSTEHRVKFIRQVSRTNSETVTKDDNQEVLTNPVEQKEEKIEENSAFSRFWALLDTIKVEGNEITSIVQMGMSWIPFVTPETCVYFENIDVSANIEMFEKVVGKGKLVITSDGKHLELVCKINVTNLQAAIDIWNSNKFNFMLVLGNSTKSPFKDVRLIYDNEKIVIHYKTYQYLLYKKPENTTDDLNKSPRYEITHHLNADYKKIFVNSTFPLDLLDQNEDKVGHTLFRARNLKAKLKFENDLFYGHFTVKTLNVKYHSKLGFGGGLDFVLMLFPKKEILEDCEKMAQLFTSRFKINVLDNNLSFYNEPSPSKSSLSISYLNSLDFYNHIVKFTIGNIVPIYAKKVRHQILVADSLINFSIYTKGVPLSKGKSNIAVRNVKLKDDDIEYDVHLFVGLPILKSLMYGEANFFPNNNCCSRLISQYLNHLITLQGTNEGKIIIYRELLLDISLDGTIPIMYDNRIFNSYTAKLKIGIPSEIAKSFLANISNFPNFRFVFHADDMKSQAPTFIDFIFNDQNGVATLEVDLSINTEILDAKGLVASFYNINSNPKLINRITIPYGSILKLFRTFFIKMFELPEGDYIPQNIIFYIEHGIAKEINKVNYPDNTNFSSVKNSLTTNALLYIQTNPIIEFFTKTMPDILLKCGVSKLPKYFRLALRSKRLDLLWLKIFGQNESGEVKAYVTNVLCESVFSMAYPSNIMLEYGDNNYSTQVNNNFNPICVSENIKYNNSKLVFGGSIFLDYHLPPKMIISKVSHDFPFPLFIASMIREPISNPLHVFFRASPCDIALEMPFNLQIESQENIYYEIQLNNKTFIKEKLIIDQGDDKYFHICLEKSRSSNVLDLLNIENEFKIVFTQGENTLLEHEFKIDKSVYEALDLKTENTLDIFSYWLKDRQYNLYKALGLMKKDDKK